MVMRMWMANEYAVLYISVLLLVLLYPITISAQSPAAAPAPSFVPIDTIMILKKTEGFTTLIRLLKTTQVANQINSQIFNFNNDLSFFAPTDSAFSNLKSGFLNSLTDQQKNELIQFHMVPTVTAVTNFDTLSNPVGKQAGDTPSRLALKVTSSRSQVNIPLDFFIPQPLQSPRLIRRSEQKTSSATPLDDSSAGNA